MNKTKHESYVGTKKKKMLEESSWEFTSFQHNTFQMKQKNGNNECDDCVNDIQ